MLTVLINDLRRLVRDQFMVGAALFIVLISVAMRFALPAVATALREGGGFELEAYFPLFASYNAFAIGSVLTGLILGVLLLENREQGTISALRVSPLSIRRFLVIESVFAYVAAVPVILGTTLVVGIGLPSPGELLLFTLIAALFAPLMMLALATFASNKLEAFALLKVLNLLVVGPLAAYFVPAPWQYVALVFPPYSGMKAWWIATAGAGPYWHWVLICLLVQVACIAWLGRRFIKTARE